MERVASALKNAKENGYDFSNDTVEEVAVDLLTYDADIEGEDQTEIEKIVKELRGE